MKPARVGQETNLRRTAAGLLSEVLQEGREMKRALQREQRRLPLSEDRALLREMVSGALKRLPHLDWALGAVVRRGLGEVDPATLQILRVGAYQLLFLDRVPPYAAVATCVEAAKAVRPGASGFVNGVLRAVASRREEFLKGAGAVPGLEGACICLGSPLWLAKRYVARFGEAEGLALLAALQEPSALFLHVLRSCDEARCLEIMASDGVELLPERALPRTYRALGGDPLSSAAFKEGLFYLMDPASLVPALLLPAREGGLALDLCSAPGGKAFVLAGRVGGGRVIACDFRPARLALLSENAARLSLPNLRIAGADAGKPLPFRALFDSVLLDAPCSSLGTLRKHPEIRWQIAEADLSQKALRQKELLSRAAEAVAPGGHLLYSVCSIEEEETTLVAGDFLSRNGLFSPAPLDPPMPLAPLLTAAGEGSAYLLPHRTGWDGFYLALFRRRTLD